MIDICKVVGSIEFDKKTLDVYSSLDEPLFRASDVAVLIEYSANNVWKMLEACEQDEKLILPVVVGGQKRNVCFVNEHGLYNILAQSRKPIARKWRRVIFDQLIRMRVDRDMDISEQFEEWDHALDGVYWDDEAGMLMQSVTLPGGDVEQVPFEG